MSRRSAGGMLDLSELDPVEELPGVNFINILRA
jgi:hypothetical protein